MGKQYPLKIQDDDEDMMYEIAGYVDKRFSEFRKALVNQSESTIMVLACLSITEELFLMNEGTRPDTSKDARLIFSEINNTLRQIMDDIEHENDDL